MVCLGFWLAALSPEVHAALIGGAATLVAAGLAAGAVVAQIRSQARQSREAIAETERRKLKAVMYDETVIVGQAVADTAIELSTVLRILNSEIRLVAVRAAAGQTYRLPSARILEITRLYGLHSDAALRLIFLIESKRIIDPRILIFRTAIGASLHDSRQLVTSDFIVSVMPWLPVELPNGTGTHFQPPTLAQADAIVELSKQLISALDDAVSYTEDFGITMQNLLLGDLFGRSVEHRRPIDPHAQVISLDRARDLETWFRTNTAQGLAGQDAEAEAARRFDGAA